jgi:hypothetical protein
LFSRRRPTPRPTPRQKSKNEDGQNSPTKDPTKWSFTAPPAPPPYFAHVPIKPPQNAVNAYSECVKNYAGSKLLARAVCQRDHLDGTFDPSKTKEQKQVEADRIAADSEGTERKAAAEQTLGSCGKDKASRTACLANFKSQIETATGKVLTEIQVKQESIKAAKQESEDLMQECLQNATTDKKACGKDTACKKNAQNRKTECIKSSNAAFRRFSGKEEPQGDKEAKQEARRQVKTIRDSAASLAAGITKNCAGSDCLQQLRSVAAELLGKEEGEENDADLRVVANLAGRREAAKTQKACNKTTKEQRKTCANQAREDFAQAAAKDATQVTKLKFNKVVKRQASQEMNEATESCRELNGTARKDCVKETVKDLANQYSGKIPNKVLIGRAQKEMAKEAVKDVLSACNTTEDCKAQAKDAYALANGLDEDEVKPLFINRVLRQAARQQLSEQKLACDEAQLENASAVCDQTSDEDVVFALLKSEKPNRSEDIKMRVAQFFRDALQDGCEAAVETCAEENEGADDESEEDIINQTAECVEESRTETEGLLRTLLPANVSADVAERRFPILVKDSIEKTLAKFDSECIREATGSFKERRQQCDDAFDSRKRVFDNVSGLTNGSSSNSSNSTKRRERVWSRGKIAGDSLAGVTDLDDELDDQKQGRQDARAVAEEEGMDAREYVKLKEVGARKLASEVLSDCLDANLTSEECFNQTVRALIKVTGERSEDVTSDRLERCYSAAEDRNLGFERVPVNRKQCDVSIQAVGNESDCNTTLKEKVRDLLSNRVLGLASQKGVAVLPDALIECSVVDGDQVITGKVAHTDDNATDEDVEVLCEELYNDTRSTGQFRRLETVGEAFSGQTIEECSSDDATCQADPTQAPTTSPTQAPTTHGPTAAPVTSSPTSAPITSSPTSLPTNLPAGATFSPTTTPTSAPITSGPTSAPTTGGPTNAPTTGAPTPVPTTSSPTSAPTPLPPGATFFPTSAPSTAPTTVAPTGVPTTYAPTAAPTTQAPTVTPTTHAPTNVGDTIAPTTTAPTAATTQTPTAAPTTVSPTTASHVKTCTDTDGAGTNVTCSGNNTKKSNFETAACADAACPADDTGCCQAATGAAACDAFACTGANMATKSGAYCSGSATTSCDATTCCEAVVTVTAQMTIAGVDYDQLDVGQKEGIKTSIASTVAAEIANVEVGDVTVALSKGSVKADVTIKVSGADADAVVTAGEAVKTSVATQATSLATAIVTAVNTTVANLPSSGVPIAIASITAEVIKANTCTCSGGTAATGAACTSNGAALCASCNAGYTKDGNACQADAVPSNNGTTNGTDATTTTTKRDNTISGVAAAGPFAVVTAMSISLACLLA